MNAFQTPNSLSPQYLSALARRAKEGRMDILNERLHMTRSFYQLKRKDQRYGFLSQPSFVSVQIGQLLPSKKMKFTNEGLRDAVGLWCSEHRALAEARYGHIRAWNTSRVTSMKELFFNKSGFNDDIGKWDVSNVTSMRYMFYGATLFNQNISKWDVSNVTNMYGMFRCARYFNWPISSWHVSKVISMSYMFYHASSFNQSLCAWDVSNTNHMYRMFDGAHNFDQNIRTWNVGNNTDIGDMFAACPIEKTNKPSHCR